MSFDGFKTMIGALAKVHRLGVRFVNDMEKGRYIAYLTNDLRITGSRDATKLTLQYGKYHTFQVPVEDLRRAV